MMTRQLAALTLWAVIVAVSACQSTPYTPPVAQTPEPVATGPDAALAAAQQATGAAAAELYLAAGAAYFDAGEIDSANHALGSVELNALPQTHHGQYWLMASRLRLHAGDPQGAEEMLQRALRSPVPDLYAIATLGARLCLMLENVDLQRYACAIDRLSRFTPQPDEIARTHEQIWDVLGQSPALLAEAQAAQAVGVARGWWQLKASILASFSLSDQRRRLAQWRAQWPDHPANQWPPSALRALESSVNTAKHVALLVPLSGPLARAGRAVRDGFVSAHLHANENIQPGEEAPAEPISLTISVFDSAAEPIPALLERALLAGADLVVGPLVKQSVEQINALNPLIPVVTLNYLDSHIPVSSNVIQLGLAIEDEADTLVNQLLLDNIERVLVFHTYKDWSRRAAARIRESWPFPLTEQSFTDIRTITESVGEAMDVQASQRRRDDLARALGTDLEFLPRARQDVEAIVALVDTLEAKALAPALRFHFARGVPVYASSQTVRGARADDLNDLTGFRVSELPWLLHSDGFYQSMDRAFGITGNPVSSLYALGVDAFRVSDQLALLDRSRDHQLLGSTGVLALASNGRIHRELGWGIIRNGALLPMTSSRHSAEQ